MSKDATRPAKRPRTTDVAPDSYMKDTTLWLQDGNIILVSSQPQAKGFRVHRSILAMYSEFFADMFKLACPEESASQEPSKQAQDCTTVPLADTAYDLSCYLQYLYVPNYFQCGTPTSLLRLEALLGMATKYLCQRLREDVIKHLTLIYCPKFPSDTPRLPPIPALVPEGDVETHAITAIHIARLCNVPQILPVAFYYVANIDPAKYVKIRPTLSSEDQLTLIGGRSELMEAIFSEAWHWLLETGFDSSCEDDDCEKTRLEVIRTSVRRTPQAVDLFLRDMPHQTVQDCVTPDTDLTKVNEVCQDCFRLWKKAECAAYMAVWNELPSYFGLKPWPNSRS